MTTGSTDFPKQGKVVNGVVVQRVQSRDEGDEVSVLGRECIPLLGVELAKLEFQCLESKCLLIRTVGKRARSKGLFFISLENCFKQRPCHWLLPV